MPPMWRNRRNITNLAHSMLPHWHTITAPQVTPRKASWCVVALGLLMFTPLAGAQVFKCREHGKTFYQQAPCNALDRDSGLLDLQPPPSRLPSTSSTDPRVLPAAQPGSPPSVKPPGQRSRRLFRLVPAAAERPGRCLLPEPLERWPGGQHQLVCHQRPGRLRQQNRIV